jgi:hypothetical protein
MEDQFSFVADSGKKAALTKTRGGVTMKKDAVILSAADANAGVLAYAAKGTKLAHGARIGDFLRVDLEDETYGWVLADDARPSGKPKSAPTGKQLAFEPKRRAPTIKLDRELGESIVDGDGVTLSGTINGRELRDMYVLLNDKKVFFASGPNGLQAVESAAFSDKPAVVEKAALVEKAPVPVAANDNAATLPFKLELRLKEGLNRVLIVARLDEKVISYRTLYVSRRAMPAAQVAEAGAPMMEKKPASAVH